MFPFRRRPKPEAPTDWATVRQIQQIVTDRIAESLVAHAERHEDETSRLDSRVYDARKEIAELRRQFESFEQTVHAEVRTLCQNAAEATRATADAMEILRPFLLQVREDYLSMKDVTGKCLKE